MALPGAYGCRVGLRKHPFTFRKRWVGQTDNLRVAYPVIVVLFMKFIYSDHTDTHTFPL